jgi:MFS family permease
VSSYTEALRNREFRGLFTATTLSLLGDRVAAVALAIVVYARSRSALLSALVFVCVFLPYLAATPLAALGDRFPRRKMMVTADVSRAGLVALLAIPDTPLPVLYLLLLAVTAFEPVFEASRTAVTVDVFGSGPTYIAASSLNGLSYQALQVGGSALGGLGVAALSTPGVLLFDAATFLVSAALIRWYVTERPAAQPAGTGDGTRATLRATVNTGSRTILGDAMLRSWLLYALVLGTVLMAAESLCVAQAHELGHGTVAAGWLAAAMPAGGVIGTVLFGRILTGAHARNALLPAAGAALLALVLAAYHPTVAGSLVWWTLAGIGAGAINFVAPLYIAHAPAEYRSVALGLATTGLMVGQGIGGLTGGVLANLIGATLAIALIAELGLLALITLARSWPAIPALPGEMPGVGRTEA